MQTMRSRLLMPLRIANKAYLTIYKYPSACFSAYGVSRFIPLSAVQATASTKQQVKRLFHLPNVFHHKMPGTGIVFPQDKLETELVLCIRHSTLPAACP